MHSLVLLKMVTVIILSAIHRDLLLLLLANCLTTNHISPRQNSTIERLECWKRSTFLLLKGHLHSSWTGGVRLLVVTCCLRPCTKQIDTGTVTGSQYQAQRQGIYATQPSAPLPLKYRRLTRAKRTQGSNFRSCSPPKRMKGEDSTS